MQTDYTTVTEIPGVKASKEQLERLYQRYRFAYQFCNDKDVLEAACGAGQGLGYLAKVAKKVIGADIDEKCLEFARKQYNRENKIELKQFDAEKMPFAEKSFNVVILYEAIYYLKNPQSFITEASRVLRGGGILVLCTVNKDWADFNPSPYSVKYFSVPELRLLLNRGFARTAFYGGFKTEPHGLNDNITSLIKQAAIRLHLMPKTMRGKEILKRLFFGRLYPVPSEITEGSEEYMEPEPISDDQPNSSYKVIYALGYKER